MIHTEITLCNKPVRVAYCYATEIAFKLMSDIDINDFMTECSTAVNSQPPVMPDIKRTIMLILSAMTAYYDRQDKDMPIDDKELMYEASPEELGTALVTILSLRNDFYHVPSGEPADDDTAKPSDDDDSKNA